MSDAEREHQQLAIPDRVDDPIIADAHPEHIRRTRELLRSRRSRLFGERTESRVDPALRLARQRIEIPIVERPDGLLIRTSTHFYNTEDELNHLAEVLPDLLMACRQG